MTFRLVSGNKAGPAALGILVPPGTRTVLVVRPRSLGWDLLLVRGVAGTAFREMDREEASATARSLFDALQEWGRGGPGVVQPVRGEGGFLVWIDVGDFCLVACERRPGQPYRPLLLAAEDEARQVASHIAAVLHPPEHGEQEVYFNTRHFTP
jgi:hypothetical protein